MVRETLHPRTAPPPVPESPPSPQTLGSVLVVEDEEGIRKLVSVALRRAGHTVTTAVDGIEALERIAEATPDLIVSDVMMPNLDGFGLLERLRQDPATRTIPVILLTARGDTEDVVAGLSLGADDYLAKPFKTPELLARVQAKIARPSIPADVLPQDRQTGLLSEPAFVRAAQRELARACAQRKPGGIAYLDLYELPSLRTRFGAVGEAQIAKQVAALVQGAVGEHGAVGRDAQGRFMLLLPNASSGQIRRQLASLSQEIVGSRFTVGQERVRLTPTSAFAPFAPDATVAVLREHVQVALEHAAAHLDLQPVRYDPKMDAAAAQRAAERKAAQADRPWGPWLERLRVPFQIAITALVGMVIPFIIYATLAHYGYDITWAMYLVVVAGLLVTASLIWVEGFLALRRVDPPEEPGTPYPPASAIIAAYLPNEAATVVETIEAFLRVQYPTPLQIILAYNTPRDLPVEAELQAIAERDSRFVPLRVQFSTSKAQNVNAALSGVTGEFVGVFDADHHPQPDSFTRAWRWLSSGFDVVQGHCLIRNGDASWVARMTAVEFEGIYAVSHPGRARLHGFGIFGGSNGYWKADLLRQTRMHGFMLTEDIDSSLRVVEAGYKIQSDPHLISRELAPAEFKALWNQRLRWAQGWFQVSLKRLLPSMRSPHLTFRQKLGMFHLLAWREFFPWLALQMFPIIAFWIWSQGFDQIDWVAPFFIATTLFTLGSGPGQAFFLHRLAAPEIRNRRGWIAWYSVVSFFFYTEFKSLIDRVAQVKEAMRERAWKVTPRSGAKQT